MKTRMLYHAEAVGACGYLTLPVQESMPIQASCALPINGGHCTTRSDKYSHRGIFAFDSAESGVVGSYSDGDAAHGSLSTVTINGLNIMGMVTCDQIVVRITTKHPEKQEPSIIPIGCYLTGLRIAGQDVRPELSIDTFTKYDTWGALNKAYTDDPAVKAQLDKQSFIAPTGNTLPTGSNGVFGCTLVRDWGKLPEGVTAKDGGIYIPHFGTLTLGEFYVGPASRRVMMLHVDLGCSVEGCYGAGSGGGNGFPFP